MPFENVPFTFLNLIYYAAACWSLTAEQCQLSVAYALTSAWIGCLVSSPLPSASPTNRPFTSRIRLPSVMMQITSRSWRGTNSTTVHFDRPRGEQRSIQAPGRGYVNFQRAMQACPHGEGDSPTRTGRSSTRIFHILSRRPHQSRGRSASARRPRPKQARGRRRTLHQYRHSYPARE